MSHRAVTEVNAQVAPKDAILEAEPADSGRRQQAPSQAGWGGGVLRRGGSDSTVTGRVEQLEKPSSSRREIGGGR